MPRIARIIAAGYPHHITQRGNNRATVFFDDVDRVTFLRLLRVNARKQQLQVLAYCLMDNHIHLLVVPETEGALSRGIGLTNMMYTQYLNRKLDHSGRIWQNRFFSCIVENDQHLWDVARYIERNPLRTGVVTSAEAYRWSSARSHLAETTDPLLYEPSWLSPDKRSAYSEFLHLEDEDTDEAIRRITRIGRPFGSEQFIDMLELKLDQPLRARRPGRPRKS